MPHDLADIDERLLRDVMPEVPGCPRPVASQRLLRAAEDFCRDTHVWIDEVDRFLMRRDVNDYEVWQPSEGKVIALARVRDDEGQHLHHTFYMEEMKLRLDNPQEGSRAVIVAALMPSRNKMPEWIVSMHGEAIAAGAKARLMMMPGVEWSAPELGQFYRLQFAQGKSEARTDRARKHSEAGQSVKKRRWV